MEKLMFRLRDRSRRFFQTQNFDAFAAGVVDFKEEKFHCFQLEKESGRPLVEDGEPVFFDLASLTKPLVNGVGMFARPDLIDEDMKLLLNHQAGLPAWGLLPRSSWREELLAYPIKKSSTLYSDYSALRFMLEFNRKSKETLHEVAASVWDEEVVFWKRLSEEHKTVQNGFRSGRPNYRAVHDPNAFVIDDWTSHAGLFGSISGVCKTLLAFDRKHGLLKRMEKDLAAPHERFVHGWDTVANPADTLAGNGCGERVFGHLGFTGAAIWIDPVKMLGHVSLSNATKIYWYDKKMLNEFRKSFGELVWSHSFKSA